MPTKTDTVTEKRYLRCVLTEDERRQIASDMAQAVCIKDALDNEMASIKAQFNAKVKEAEAKISGSAEKIRAGYEMREVDVEVVIDHEEGYVTETRTDTGEIITSRKLTPAERQMTF